MHDMAVVAMATMVIGLMRFPHITSSRQDDKMSGAAECCKVTLTVHIMHIIIWEHNI